MKPLEYKRLALVAAVIVASALAWWTARLWLNQPAPFTQWVAMIAPALAVTLLGAVTGLAWMLLDRWPERTAAVLGSWASFVLFWPGNPFYLSALPVFALLWWSGLQLIQHDISDRRKVRINATLALGMKVIILGAFLMISLGFYLTPHAQSADSGTIVQGVQRSLDTAYHNQLVQAQLQRLSPTAQAQVRADVAISVDRTVRTWLAPIATFIPPLLAFGLFIVLWSVSFIFREAAIWLGVVIFALLRETGFVKVGEEDVKAEVVKL